MTCDALPVYSVALLSSQASHRRILTRVLVGIFKTGITQLCTLLSSQASHRRILTRVLVGIFKTRVTQ